MAEELSKTEARQGDRRRMNKTVLFVATPLALVAMAIVAWMMA
jgi:hypothetical protein